MKKNKYDTKDKHFKDEKLNLSTAPTATTINSTAVLPQQFEPGEGGDGSKLFFEDNGNDKTADEKLVENNPEDIIRHWKKCRRQTYNYFSLFRFASKKDKILMLVGLFASIASGLCIPLMIWLFGNLARKMVFVSLKSNARSCHKNPCLGFYLKCNFTYSHPKYDIYTRDLILEEFYKFSTEHAVLSAVFTVLTGLYFYCWYYPAEKQIARMQLAYFEALLRKDASWSDSRGDRDFANKIMENTSRIREGIGESFPMGVSLHVMYFVSLVMAFCHGWALSLLSFVGLAILSFCSSLVSSSHARQVIIEEKCYGTAREFAKEVLTCIRTVLVYGAQRNVSGRYRQEIETPNTTVNKSMVMTSLAIGLKWLLTMWIFALVLWYGLGCILRDLSCGDRETFYNILYDSGDLIVIFFCVFFVMVNDGPMFPFYLSLKIATLCGRDVFWIIDTKSDIDSMGTEGFNSELQSTEPISGKIDFEDVRFTYPSGNTNIPVLNGVNLSIAPGTRVGIVGTTGCGKSTLLNLILKEYSADSGFVKIDGIDIKSVNTHWIRSNIGVVSQDPGLFDDTIEQNVRMGKLNSSFFEIQDACKKANAHDFIVALKEGYQTKIGVDGNKLTAGQRKRLAIARALVRNPKILLLDEPTTSLDSYSESVVMQTLEKVGKFRTVIIVAHRLQTIVNADIIFVMKRGKVVEKGTHAVLLKSKGPYSQLASGLFDWQSGNRLRYHLQSEVEPFDVTERNATNYLKSFNVVPLLTNRYNNLLSLDAVTEKATKRYILQREANLKHQFRGRDEFYFSLSAEKKKAAKLSDSIMKIEYPTVEQIQKDVERQEELVEAYVHATSSEDEIESITYTYWKILLFVSKNVIFISLGVVFSCVVGLATPLYGVFFAGVFTRLCHPEHWTNWDKSDWEFIHNLGNDKAANYWLIGFVCLGIILGVASTLQNIFLTLAGYQIVKRLRKKLFSLMLQQDESFFDDPQNTTTDLTTILDSSVGSMRFIVTSFYGTFIQCVVTIIASIVYCCIYNGKLTGYVIAMFPVIIGFPLCESWLRKLHDKKVASDIEQMSGLILEVFSKRHSVSSLQLEPYFIDRLNIIQKRVHKSKNRYVVGRVISFALAHSACYWAYTLFIYFGGNEIAYREERFEDVLAIGEILMFGLIALGVNLSVIASFDIAVTEGEKIVSLLQREPGIRNGGGEIVTSCSGEINMRDVHFWYPYSTDVPQLREISLKMEPGSLVAIVGSSESGKSSYLSILLRLYDPIGGAISLDGVDIKALNVPSYRSNFRLLDSLPQLFNATVAENIAYGDNTRDVTMKDVIEAAKKANAHHMIVSLPNGYNTNIGTAEENLVTLGQKQRICLARALLREPSVIIFHEAVSNLDRENEKILIESLEEARQNLNLTCIVIAQRLHSIQKADLICFMYDGEIVERGSHKQLLKNKGKYFDMWKQQNPLADDNFKQGRMPYNSDNQRRRSAETIVVKKERQSVSTADLSKQPETKVSQLPDPQSSNSNPQDQNQGKKTEGQPQSWGMCNIFGE